jgi:hypothetical protein
MLGGRFNRVRLGVGLVVGMAMLAIAPSALPRPNPDGQPYGYNLSFRDVLPGSLMSRGLSRGRRPSRG